MNDDYYASPHSSEPNDPIPFLTPKRIEVIEDAIRRARQHIANYVTQHGDFYWSMTKRARTNWCRSIYVSALNKAFSDQDNVVIREDNGGFYIVLDGDGLLHPKKLNHRTLLAWIPQTLRKNIHSQQLPLPSDEFITAENMPLNQLRCLIIGFDENKLGDLEALYITEQYGDEILYRLPLDITTTIPFETTVSEETDIPSVKFKAKKKDDTKKTGTS